MLYSVKMRSAQGGSHEMGGRHISGAERIVREEVVKQAALAMIERAFRHSRGAADFINLKIEGIEQPQIQEIALLPIVTGKAATIEQGREQAILALVQAGVTERAAYKGMEALAALPDSMRGAMILSAVDGRRLDSFAKRGVRVSAMDVADGPLYEKFLAEQGLTNLHVREALVLASKVQAAPGVVAELCWSDDPDYTTGYVGSSQCYFRLPHLKRFGSPSGGRAFFVTEAVDLDNLVDYLENQPVLAIPQEADHEKIR